MAASIDSGWHEKRMDDALSPKTVLDNKETEAKSSVTNVDL